jgi:predicted alpha/beta-fold hydrolase
MYNINRKKTNNLVLLHSRTKLAKYYKMITEFFLENYTKSVFYHGHFQTFLLGILDILIQAFRQYFKFFNFKYDRIVFTLRDGGKIPVDITKRKKNEFYSDIYEPYEHTNKILVVVPGFTSSSTEYYIKNFLEDLVNDFECHVMNVRGVGMKLYNPVTISTHCYKDVREYIESVCKDYPDKKVFAVGFSFGGMLLARSLGTNPEALPSNFVGGCGVCYPFSIDSVKKHVLGKNIGFLYSKFSARNMKKTFLDNLDVIFDSEKCKPEILNDKLEIIKKIEEMEYIHEIDEIYTARVLGFKTIEEYYEDSRIDKYLENIKVPFLSVFTEDDPIIPHHEVPINILKKNDNLITIISKNGGHMGFFSGVIPKRWIDLPIRSFLKTVDIIHDSEN